MHLLTFLGVCLAAAPKGGVFVGLHHKTGGLWSSFNRMSKLHLPTTPHLTPQIVHSLATTNTKLLHWVRSPKRLVASAYVYHYEGREKWTYSRQPSFECPKAVWEELNITTSYQVHLKSLSLKSGILAEITRCWFTTCTEMNNSHCAAISLNNSYMVVDIDDVMKSMQRKQWKPWIAICDFINANPRDCLKTAQNMPTSTTNLNFSSAEHRWFYKHGTHLSNHTFRARAFEVLKTIYMPPIIK